MKFAIQQKNIVVNGQFDLTQLDKYFFIKNAVLTEEEFAKMKPSPIFNSLNVHMASEQFELIITPVQLVIYTVDPEKNSFKVNNLLIKLFNSYTSATITNFGMNFDVALEYGSQDEVKAVSKEYFFASKSPLISAAFDAKDAAFGFYASKDVLDARLKLDIKPLNSLNSPAKGVIPFDALYHQFNYHFVLKESKDIVPLLEKYELYEDETNKMVSYYKK